MLLYLPCPAPKARDTGQHRRACSATSQRPQPAPDNPDSVPGPTTSTSSMCHRDRKKEEHDRHIQPPLQLTHPHYRPLRVRAPPPSPPQTWHNSCGGGHVVSASPPSPTRGAQRPSAGNTPRPQQITAAGQAPRCPPPRARPRASGRSWRPPPPRGVARRRASDGRRRVGAPP
ncbi:hypothetical protein BU14_0087s0035 [Porphyra umbilicalis]|uniref:Uncharacterized protein n=1 Tax=Porphyra umbilicalis TaxID=2786 RepID=A0A1X6PE11_PORUM|nr:hypothetical protein BU14_0087s0035 [Porphyra umbilicalis]|eukprot:OSX79088.1 hypothetical protein BU14_0087s0035 [Porphyra umbilicalis]